MWVPPFIAFIQQSTFKHQPRLVLKSGILRVWTNKSRWLPKEWPHCSLGWSQGYLEAYGDGCLFRQWSDGPLCSINLFPSDASMHPTLYVSITEEEKDDSRDPPSWSSLTPHERKTWLNKENCISIWSCFLLIVLETSFWIAHVSTLARVHRYGLHYLEPEDRAADGMVTI